MRGLKTKKSQILKKSHFLRGRFNRVIFVPSCEKCVFYGLSDGINSFTRCIIHIGQFAFQSAHNLRNTCKRIHMILFENDPSKDVFVKVSLAHLSRILG